MGHDNISMKLIKDSIDKIVFSITSIISMVFANRTPLLMLSLVCMTKSLLQLK